tara:strand:+ start:150 stop:374 length:225 start_codon:yes stop_codon:yes gene_type:complete
MKYKNKDGIELNFDGMSEAGKMGSGVDLIQRVVSKAVVMLEDVNEPGPMPMRAHHRVGIQKTIDFLKENFDLYE